MIVAGPLAGSLTNRLGPLVPLRIGILLATAGLTGAELPAAALLLAWFHLGKGTGFTQSQKTTSSPSERLKPAPPGPSGSRK